MAEDKGILIKNIYYMLAYAFQILRQSNYEEIDAEHFEEAQDLFAAILAKGIAQLLKQGLYREYISKDETAAVLRGKIDIPKSINNRVERRRVISFEYDELSENNLFNQIAINDFFCHFRNLLSSTIIIVSNASQKEGALFRLTSLTN